MPGVRALVALAGFAVLHASAGEQASARPIAFSASIRGAWGIPVVRVELESRTLRYDNGRGSRANVSPSAAQWQAFRRALDEIGVWGWKPEYVRNVTDAGGWSLDIEYPDRALHARGYAAGPGAKAWAKFQYAAEQLLGGRPLGGRRIGRLQLYDLAELKLLATRAGGTARERRAVFGAPDGRTYHARIGDYVGSDYGAIKAIKLGAVLLLELKTDSNGDWYETETWVRKAGQ